MRNGKQEHEHKQERKYYGSIKIKYLDISDFLEFFLLFNVSAFVQPLCLQQIPIPTITTFIKNVLFFFVTMRYYYNYNKCT